MRNKIVVSVAVLAAGLALASSASAAINLVANGGFEATTNGNGQLAFNTAATGWDVPALNNSYVFLFGAGTADTTGANGQFGNVQLWGPGNGSANGLTGSPDGGNFLASDPAFHNGAISQVITGLHAGQTYKVTFDWAGAQQFHFDGETTEGWQVSLGGGPSQSTTPLDTTPNHGFVPWQTTTFQFVADGASDTLSFLALGGPSDTIPPFALLDGVTMTEVPEPATWALMILGFGGMGAMVRNRRRQATVTA
jgi:hypothetical protein